MSDWPLGAVDLKVLDLEREVTFYEWFGLTRMSGDGEHALLGVSGHALLRLTLLARGQARDHGHERGARSRGGGGGGPAPRCRTVGRECIQEGVHAL